MVMNCSVLSFKPNKK